jgi:ATP-dependent protease HslVU (ClpYQ) peptidase subunit
VTAIIAVPQRERVHVLTDGAFMDIATGCMVGTAPKTWMMPKQSAAMVFAGSAAPGAALHEVLARETQTFDEIEARAGEMLQALYSFFRGRLPVGFVMVCAGLSE